MSVMPMRCDTSACWLARGRLSISVSPVAVCAWARLPANKTADNNVRKRTLCMGKLLFPPSDSGDTTEDGFAVSIGIANNTWGSDAVALRRIEADYVSMVAVPEHWMSTWDIDNFVKLT